jgi:hypothetical protein
MLSVRRRSGDVFVDTADQDILPFVAAAMNFFAADGTAGDPVLAQQARSLVLSNLPTHSLSLSLSGLCLCFVVWVVMGCPMLPPLATAAAPPSPLTALLSSTRSQKLGKTVWKAELKKTARAFVTFRKNLVQAVRYVLFNRKEHYTMFHATFLVAAGGAARKEWKSGTKIVRGGRPPCLLLSHVVSLCPIISFLRADDATPALLSSQKDVIEPDWAKKALADADEYRGEGAESAFLKVSGAAFGFPPPAPLVPVWL